MSKKIQIVINRVIEVSEEEITDLMVTALEGGINYWCGSIEFKNPEKFDDLMASDALAKGAEFILHDAESDDTWDLTLEKFLKGLKTVMEEDGYSRISDLMNDHDVDTADRIMQYALFNEIVFG